MRTRCDSLVANVTFVGSVNGLCRFVSDRKTRTMLSRSRKPSCETTESGAFTCSIGICKVVRVKVTSDPLTSRSLLLKEIKILLRLESSETNFEHIVRYYQAWQEHGASEASDDAYVGRI
jgi:hypothetical protein